MIGNGRCDPRIIQVGEELPPMEARPERPRKAGADKSAEPKRKRPAGERFRTLNAFVDCTMAGLSRSEIAVWFVLYRDTRNGTAKASMRDIARRAGCSHRAVVTAVSQLEKRGLLQIVSRGDYRRGATRYRVAPLAKP